MLIWLTIRGCCIKLLLSLALNYVGIWGTEEFVLIAKATNCLKFEMFPFYLNTVILISVHGFLSEDLCGCGEGPLRSYGDNNFSSNKDLWACVLTWF